MKKYLPRYTDYELKESLEYMGAVLITGPKWCGKTTTAKQQCNSLKELQHPVYGKSYLKLADTNPIELLKGEKPMLIDEWQMAPELWDAVRYLVDESDEDGLYILTGSTIVDESKIMHSGAGRIKRIVMRPMSLYESGESTGAISLMDLFNDEDLNIDGITSNLSISDFKSLVLFTRRNFVFFVVFFTLKKFSITSLFAITFFIQFSKYILDFRF